jgi:hypothetical protein
MSLTRDALNAANAARPRAARTPLLVHHHPAESTGDPLHGALRDRLEEIVACREVVRRCDCRTPARFATCVWVRPEMPDSAQLSIAASKIRSRTSGPLLVARPCRAASAMIGSLLV